MPLDINVFKDALASFPSGITICTTQDAAGRAWGFTASAFSSLSLDPPLILVCLDRRAESHDAFFGADRFAVSILAAHQLPLAIRFATRGLEKFEGVTTTLGSETNVPLIPEAVVHLECRMHQALPVGDHTILVGEVVAASFNEDEPLITHSRRYGTFQAQPAPAAP
ncbi:MAG: flavin reductase family protein [Dehalococcoidia bacterium]